MRVWALSAVLALVGSLVATAGAARADVAQSPSDGWQIGPDALDLVNPLAQTPAIAEKGAQLYRSKCQRCHGRTGVGNGPDADRDSPPRDLTDGTRAARNPDGVLFYKIWNGRSRPKMPAFKTDVSRDDVWAIVHFVKALRAH